MPFTFYNPPTLTPAQTNPFAGILQNALNSYSGLQKARYLPQSIQADIFSKEFSPLAQIASSPLALAMLPDQKNQLNTLLSQLLSQMGGGQSGGSGGSPGSSVLNSIFGGNTGGNSGGGGGGGGSGGSAIPSGNQGAPMGAPSSSGATLDEQARRAGFAPGTREYAAFMQNNGAAQQSTASSDNSYNPNIPQAGQGLGGGAQAKATGTYAEQVHPPGVSYYDAKTNSALSSPTGSQVDRGQTTMTAYGNLVKLVPKLLNESKEFENKSLDIKRAQTAQRLNSYHLGMIGNLVSQNPNLAGDYNNFNQDVTKAGVVLKGIYPTSEAQASYDQHRSMLDFNPEVDTVKTYKARLQGILNDAKIAYGEAQKQAGSKGGYNLSQSPDVPNLDNAGSSSGKIPVNDNNNSTGGDYDPTTILNYKFKSPNEFRQSFNTLNDDAKRKVIAEMRRREKAS